MKLALVADAYWPMRTSAAVQLHDLALEFKRQKHDIVVIVPSPDLKKSWLAEEVDGVQVLRLKTFRIKDINYFQRTASEFLMPYLMKLAFRKCPYSLFKFNGVVWYAPSIFHGPFISYLKRVSCCKGYLIQRDIFPQWALDMGLMKKNLAYLFFKCIEKYHYSVANVIGVQSPGNQSYFDRWSSYNDRKLQVLNNWISSKKSKKCSINLTKKLFKNKKIFLYIGNIGPAQDANIFIDLADRYKNDGDVVFMFVGRGSELMKLKMNASRNKLPNVVFFDEIDSLEIDELCSQCSIGIVSLNTFHNTHNIPGKFLSYMHAGLPVIARINPNNDLIKIITDNFVGTVSTSNSLDDLFGATNYLLKTIKEDKQIKNRCKTLAKKIFSTEHAVKQIVAALR